MKNRKLVLVVNVDWFFRSHRLPISLSAISAGYEVHLVCRDTGMFDELSSLGIVVHDMPFARSGFNPILEFFVLLRLLFVIARIQPQVIHAISSKPVIYVGLLGWIFPSAKKIFSISGLGGVFSSGSAGFFVKIRKYVLSTLYRISIFASGGYFIFQNSTDQSVISGLAAGRIRSVIIPGSGVDLEVYKPSERTPQNYLVFTMACRLLKDKGVREFIRASNVVDEAKAPFENVRFLLAGSPDSENAGSISFGEISKLDDRGVVEVLGHCEDIPTLFSKTDVVVLPSYYGEGLPKVLIEAAACGKAVITTDHAGCRDAIIEGETGLLVSPRSEEQLVAAMLQFIANPDLVRQFGARGRRHAEDLFSIQSVIETHLFLYSEEADSQ